MSVMVLSELQFVVLKNTLVNMEYNEKVDGIKKNSWKWSEVIDEKYKNLVTYLYKMNVLNYCTRYNEKVEFIDIDFEISKNQLFTKDETIDVLKSLRYNTDDYFPTDDIDDLIKKIEK